MIDYVDNGESSLYSVDGKRLRVEEIQEGMEVRSECVYKKISKKEIQVVLVEGEWGEIRQFSNESRGDVRHYYVKKLKKVAKRC